MPVWVYILVYLFEGFTAYLFFSEISLRRRPLPACIAVGLLTFGLAMVQNVAMGNSNVFWNVIFSALAVFLFALFSFSMKPLHILAYSAILTALNLAAELIVVFATSSLADASTEALYAQSYLFALDTLGSKLLYFLACYLLSRLAAPSNQRTRVPVSLFLYPAALLGCLLGFWYICAEPATSDQARQVLTLLSVVLFLATVTLFLAFQHEIRRDSELLSIRQEYERQKMEQEYYGILEQQNQHLMIYAHDAKNHLAAIQALNTDPQIDAYVAALSGDLTAYAQGLHSGNKMLDVILEKYLRSCRQKGIDFHFEVACLQPRSGGPHGPGDDPGQSAGQRPHGGGGFPKENYHPGYRLPEPLQRAGPVQQLRRPAPFQRQAAAFHEVRCPAPRLWPEKRSQRPESLRRGLFLGL